jgi:DNA-binding MarR family transcriptional regulator
MASTTDSCSPPEEKLPEVTEAWPRFLRAHAAITRQMDADLIAAHDLTLSDYEVLLRLANAPERRMRRVDLAEESVLTQSGITRLLAGLEKSGCVERVCSDTDGRVFYARLTDEGLATLREASKTHIAGIERLFAGNFSEAELETLTDLLARLPATRTENASCGID